MANGTPSYPFGEVSRLLLCRPPDRRWTLRFRSPFFALLVFGHSAKDIVIPFWNILLNYILVSGKCQCLIFLILVFSMIL